MRGTIGGIPGENLTPIDIVEMAAAFGQLIKTKHRNPSVVIGRDARVSGSMVAELCAQTLIAQGFHVYNAGLSTLEQHMVERLVKSGRVRTVVATTGLAQANMRIASV